MITPSFNNKLQNELWQIENQLVVTSDNLKVAMSSNMTHLKQKQEIVLQKLSKANRTVRITDYTIMFSAHGVDNEWNSKFCHYENLD